jgi:Rod binding domain-containing protein
MEAIGFPVTPVPGGPGRPAEAARDNPAAIQDAARGFEALLIAQLIRGARQTGSEGWLGTGEDRTASSAMELAEEQFAQALAAQGGLGLAGLITSGLVPRPGDSVRCRSLPAAVSCEPDATEPRARASGLSTSSE